jgi:osmotically-inducible protein OsmY
MLMALTLILPLSAACQAANEDDERIEGAVRAALASHPALGDERITVVVTDGVVELSGYVDNRREQTVADALASRVEGVRAVDNLLERDELPERVGVDADR